MKHNKSQQPQVIYKKTGDTGWRVHQAFRGTLITIGTGLDAVRFYVRQVDRNRVTIGIKAPTDKQIDINEDAK